MPKHKAKTGLGNSLMNDRQKKGGKKNLSGNHVADFIQGEAASLKARSVLERNALDDYLATALTAGENFEVIRERTIINSDSRKVVTRPQRSAGASAGVNIEVDVPIPRRAILMTGPKAKDKNDVTAEQLHTAEQDAFLKWRKTLAQLEEEQGHILTPFEKNLEFWRQLWRVIEKSDIVVQILDARNPLFFRCKDLEKYIREVDPNKQIIILINKADFLPVELRQQWVEYFNGQGLEVIFFSALRELHAQGHFIPQKTVEGEADAGYGEGGHSREEAIGYGNLEREEMSGQCTDVVDCDSLLRVLLKRVQGSQESSEEGHTPVIGMVGFPNVGKSSVINALFGLKKTSVSRQPGKTKHFQTLPMPHLGITLCDCPGLVFPNIVFTKYHLAVNGIIPIEQFRGDIVPAIQLICDKLPHIPKLYSIGIKPQSYKTVQLSNGQSVSRLDAFEFCSAYAVQRKHYCGGGGGQPDVFRVARKILRDYCTGKLLYCEKPPVKVIDVENADSKNGVDDNKNIEEKEEESRREVENTSNEISTGNNNTSTTSSSLYSSDGRGFTSIFSLTSNNKMPEEVVKEIEAREEECWESKWKKKQEEQKKEEEEKNKMRTIQEEEEEDEEDGEWEDEDGEEEEEDGDWEDEEEEDEWDEEEEEEEKHHVHKSGGGCCGGHHHHHHHGHIKLNTKLPDWFTKLQNKKKTEEKEVVAPTPKVLEEKKKEIAVVTAEELENVRDFYPDDDDDFLDLVREKKEEALSLRGDGRVTKRGLRKTEKRSRREGRGMLEVSVEGRPNEIRNLREHR